MPKPLIRSPPRIPAFARTSAGTRSCRVGKGVGTFVPCAQDYRAPCPRVTDRSRSYANAWARRTRGFIVKQGCASAFAHPTRSLRLSSSKENRPLFAALGQGVALIPVFSLPSQARGLARRQGAWPGLRQTGPRVRGSRAGPERRALGVKRHAPRLAAHQRGILAFVPLTVVGPGRLIVADEAARARPGDEGCVRPSHAGAAPVPRLQNASGRRPSKLGSG